MHDTVSISDYYRNTILPSVRGDILRESEEQILGSNPNELSDFYYDKYKIINLEEDPAQEASYDVFDYLADIPAHKRDGFYAHDGDLKDFPCQKITIEVPIRSNSDISIISRYRADTHSLSYSDRDFTWEENKIFFSFQSKGYGISYHTDQLAKEIESGINKIKEVIRFKNDSITKNNSELHKHILKAIEGRKRKIKEDSEKMRELTQKISIPLKKKISSGQQSVPVKQTLLVQKIKPKPNLPEEYTLEEEKVNDIVEYIDRQAKTYETTPAAINKLGEEDIRDLILGSLNTVFDGGATGETFSKKGKSDIYLKINKGNILIAECKIWGGQSLYKETIDQLRGYLTWRHNYGIMITFVRIKSFTKALSESEVAIQNHKSYIKGFKKLNATHFISYNTVDDDDKEVKIHHLFYHLPLL